MFVAINENGNAIFNGLTPERNSLFMRYAKWLQLDDLKKEQSFQFPMYRNDGIVSELAKYDIQVKMEPIEKVLEFLRKEN